MCYGHNVILLRLWRIMIGYDLYIIVLSCSLPTRYFGLLHLNPLWPWGKSSLCSRLLNGSLHCWADIGDVFLHIIWNAVCLSEDYGYTVNNSQHSNSWWCIYRGRNNVQASANFCTYSRLGFKWLQKGHFGLHCRSNKCVLVCAGKPHLSIHVWVWLDLEFNRLSAWANTGGGTIHACSSWTTSICWKIFTLHVAGIKTQSLMHLN